MPKIQKSSEVNEEFFTTGSSVVWKKQLPEKYEIATREGDLMTKEGPQKYQSGYYIIQGPEGEKYSMPASKFAELKDDLGNGVATPKRILKLGKLIDHNGSVKTAWGETLNYKEEEDYLVRHGKGDYGVVKKAIFQQTYQTEKNSAAQPNPPSAPHPLKLPTRLAPLGRSFAPVPSLAQKNQSVCPSTSVDIGGLSS